MEHIGIINRIIDAERQAREIAESAREKRERLQEDLQKEQEALRTSYDARVQRRLRILEKNEKDAADQHLAEMEDRFQKEMAEMDHQFKENQEAWADTLFSMIVRR